MPSLTTCMKKAGAALHPADKAAILARAAALRRDGKKAAEAAVQAVEDQLREVQQQLRGMKGSPRGEQEKQAAEEREPALLSRAEHADGGTSPEVLRQLVDRLSSEWTDGPPVGVVATAHDLPAEIRSMLESQDHAGQARAIVDDSGSVWLIADKLPDLETAKFALFHEVYGHYGLRMIFGPTAYAQEMTRLRSANPALRAEADRWLVANASAEVAARVRLGMTDAAARTEVRLLSVEEALADRAGHDETIGGFRSLMARLQRALRALGMESVANLLEGMTQAETMALLNSAREAVRSGKGGHVFVDTVPAVKRLPKLSRAAAATAPVTNHPATLKPSTGVVDRTLRAVSEGARLNRITSGALSTVIHGVDRALSVFGDSYEYAKAGLVDRYGLSDEHAEAKTLMKTRIRQNARQTGEVVDKLRALDRQQSRVAYLWMQEKPSPEMEQLLLSQLPPEPREVLLQLKSDIDRLSRQAVDLGLLSQEAYDRNAMAYLHRSYERHEREDLAAKVARGNSVKILGNQFKGRGLRDDAAQVGSADWFARQRNAGPVDQVLKGLKFNRLELREEPSGPAVEGPPALGRLRQVVYWPASDAIPEKYASWRNDGQWEARFFDKPGKVGLWRDFTLEERTRMGEIQEVKFSVAKTMLQMVRDVETARFLDWVMRNESKSESELPEGAKVVDASDRLTRSYLRHEWVQVPSTKIPGTGITRYGNLAGGFVPGPVWNDLRQISSMTDQGDLGHAYSQMLKAWKLSKTALSPVTHTNNVMSNFIMADLHDIQARHMARALKAWVQHRSDAEAKKLIADYQDNGGDAGMFNESEIREEIFRPLIEELELEVKRDTGTALVSAAQVLDLLTHRQFRQAYAAIGRTRTASVLGWPAKKLMKLYGVEDEVFRLAAFIKAREDGLSDYDAGKFARDSFLNYEISAPWINALRQTAMPFIAFTYRAVPMLVKTMTEKPHKAAKYWLVATALNTLAYMMLGGGDDDEARERALLPDEKAGKVWGIMPKLMRMPWNDEHESPVFLDVRRWVPGGDVVDFGQQHTALPVPPPLMPGGPAVILGELLLNRSGFTGKNITLETDTLAEKYGKVADYLWKGMAPNFPGVPGTYSTTALMNAGKGKTDTFSREQSIGQAAAAAAGVKLASYPRDVLERNAQIGTAMRIAEIRRDVHAMERQLALKGITPDEFKARLARAVEKIQKENDELNKKKLAGAKR